MTTALVLLSAGEAQRLTQRIKLTASSVRDGMFKLRNLVEEAKRSNVWQVLGYQSWTAYLADTLADEPMRLGRDERQELVGYLAGEGLSTRAIAPIVGVSHETVAKDIAAPVKNLTPEPSVEAPPAASPTSPEATVVRVEEPPTPPRAIVGLDGKSYAPRSPAPRAEPVPVDVERQNAEDAAKALGRALMTLASMESPAHRARIIGEWWPLGCEAVPPDSRALFEPYALRDISMWLMRLAGELEATK